MLSSYFINLNGELARTILILIFYVNFQRPQLVLQCSESCLWILFIHFFSAGLCGTHFPTMWLFTQHVGAAWVRVDAASEGFGSSTCDHYDCGIDIWKCLTNHCDQPKTDNLDYLTNQRMECRYYFHSLCVLERTFNSVFSELKKWNLSGFEKPKLKIIFCWNRAFLFVVR